MLEYLWSHWIARLAQYYPTELQRCSSTDDPERYYMIASICDRLTCAVKLPFDPPLVNGLRFEVAPHNIKMHWVRPGEAIEFNEFTSWQRMYYMLRTLACNDSWEEVFSHFTATPGSYTIYAHVTDRYL